MALIIDGSSPAAATGNPSATTATFTPPAGSILVVAFSGNTFTAANPGVPTVTDNLGSHLTYTLSDWQSHVDSPAVSGQCALWTAPVVTSQAMTVTVTNNDGSARDAAIKVWVITGQDSITPLGAHGKSGSTSASAIAQSYTAQATGGQGFIVTCDWDTLGNQTAGTGCTVDATGSPGSQFTYGFARRTTDDDSNGAGNTLNVTLPGSSTNLTWAWIELLPQVGDPPQFDPPPFIQFHPPGLNGPDGWANPWLGTDNAAPDATGVRIDNSSPGVAVNTVAGTSALTTATFTPPAGSLLLILWAGNSFSGASPSQPTITDNLGVHLTYTLTDWQSHADAPAVNGQAAAWTAPVSVAAPMTVTVSNLDGSARQAEMQVLVLTGAASSPVGAHGKGGSTSTRFLAQSYTPTVTGGQGFISVCDWDATGTPAPGTDCWIAHVGDLGTIAGTISYAQVKRTIPDDVVSVSNRLNVSMAATSTNLAWVYVEIVPAVLAAGAATEGPLVPVYTGLTWPPPTAPPTVSASQPLGNPAIGSPQPLVVSTPEPGWPTVPGALISSTQPLGNPAVGSPQPLVVTPAPFTWPVVPPVSISASQPLGNPAVGSPDPLVVSPPFTPVPIPGVLLFGPGAVTATVFTATPGPLVVTPPFAWVPVPPPRILAPTSVAVSPSALVVTPPFAAVPIPGADISSSQPLGNPAVGTPSAYVVTPTASGVKVPGAFLSSNPPAPAAVVAASSPQPLVVTPPPTPAPIPAVRIFGAPAAPVVPSTPTVGPLVVGPPWRPVTIPKTFTSANYPLGNPAVGSPQPLVVTPPQRWPTWTAALVTATPVMSSCSTTRPGTGTTTRPGSGTTTYDLTTTLRPGAGITTRPNTGITEDPC